MNEDEIEKQNVFVYFGMNVENEPDFLEYMVKFLIQLMVDEDFRNMLVALVKNDFVDYEKQLVEEYDFPRIY